MKRYSLNSIAVKGGYRNVSGGETSAWSGYRINEDGTCRGGHSLDNGNNYLTYFMFDGATLATLRAKTVTKITLSITVKSGYIPKSSTNTHELRYKYNNSLGSSSQDDSWACSDADSTNKERVVVGYLKSSGNRINANNTPFDFDLTGSVLPVYGYVLGPRDANVGGYVNVADTATLTVETDEPSSSTITYDANGGTGAPAAQTKESGVPITLSSAEPVRSGYMFTKWNTAQDGSGVDYSLGATYILDEDVTLYAQWQQITQTGVWVKGSDNQMHQGTVWVKGTDGAMHEAAIYVKGSDNTMHQSS